MEIQQLPANANRMLLYQSVQNRAKTAVARPPVQGDIVAADTGDQTKVQKISVLIPDNKIPKVEEIKKMIQCNGYPYKSDVYKAVARMVESALN